EDCGGSLELAFAVSCNSVFTPLGVKLGASRLVETAEHFGFNQDPGVPGAAAIADGGHRPAPTFVAGAPRGGAQAVTPQVARTVRHLMTEVVREGTGTSAAIPGVVVAGKTGTAELKSCNDSSPEGEASETSSGSEDGESCSGPTNTDAWFTA